MGTIKLSNLCARGISYRRFSQKGDRFGSIKKIGVRIDNSAYDKKYCIILNEN